MKDLTEEKIDACQADEQTREKEHQENRRNPPVEDMRLRDVFAAVALFALIRADETWHPSMVQENVKWAYFYADTALKTRQGKF